MQTLGHDYLSAALTAAEAPCVTIYQPTHRHHPSNAQDPLHFKNRVRQVEESLTRRFAAREVRTLLEPLRRLQEDASFWNHTLDGVGVFASPERFDAFTIPRTVPPFASVADSFHVKPLLRYVQSADRFQLLALAEDRFALFEGNRDALDPIDAPSVSGAARPAAPSDPRAEVPVGEGETSYFRAVDRAVTDEVSKPADVPLVLAALAKNVTPFRTVARNPHLLSDSVVGDPFAFDTGELRARAWEVLEPHYLARLARLSRAFGTAFSRQQGTADLSDAARAAVAGRIGVLLVDADQVQPGKIDPTTGAIRAEELADPSVDDKLDDLAELVLRRGGEVVMVPEQRMPTTSGLAAIFRY